MSEFLPSACVGVVAKVVKARRPKGETGQRDFPAMIETTAAVHPGGSGGAIINSNGHMISLVTRYKKLIFLFYLKTNFVMKF